jgi:hypothetical protein
MTQPPETPPQIVWAPPTEDQLGPGGPDHGGWAPAPQLMPSAEDRRRSRRDLLKFGGIALAVLALVGVIVFALVAGLGGNDAKSPAALPAGTTATAPEASEFPTPEPSLPDSATPEPQSPPAGGPTAGGLPIPDLPQFPTDLPSFPTSLTRCASRSALITAVTYVTMASVLPSAAAECVWNGAVDEATTHEVGDLDLISSGVIPRTFEPPFEFDAPDGTVVTVDVEQQSDGYFYVTGVDIS